MRNAMPKPKTFGPHSPVEKRALQAWLVLVGKAARRETVTYGDLAVAMFGSRSTFRLGRILGHIAFYCDQHRLPPLNCIVVGKVAGKPGWGIPVYSDKERERVYREDWFDIVPPSPDDLRAAFESA
jgi:hypothetical protein